MAMGRNEVDTCRDMVVPALRAAGWQEEQIRPEYPLVAERVMTLGGIEREVGRGRVDYVLEIEPGLPVAVVEAKREYRHAADGVGQMLRYGEQLDVPVGYASNGTQIIEHDFSTGDERAVQGFRTPAEVWSDFCAHRGIDPADAVLLKQPLNRRKVSARGDVAQLRWYQQVAVNRVLAGIARGDKRLLLLMATGTGKTFTAMQIVHKLRAYARLVTPTKNYRVLYLADRDALVDQPMKKDFGIAFPGDSMARVAGRVDGKSRDIVFATYQSLTTSEAQLTRYAPDFFDLVIVDECHRGSADEQSRFHDVLAHFAPAVQVGLTATPKREQTIDTYRYFGDPVFQYSLKQGIEDGYLAPYRLRRVVLDVDAEGWEPEPGQVDDSGFLVEEGVYGTRDFDRTLVLPRRTDVAAGYLMSRLRQTRGRMIIFCRDIDHATRMREAMVAQAPDWTRDDPHWMVRITAADDDSKHLVEAFSDPELDSPLVATTSRLLATGVDVEDLKYVVLFRPIGSQIEFKQIVGRGTRLYPDKGKTSFEIIDFVGAAQHFEDPDFDGYPASRGTDVIGPDGSVRPGDDETHQPGAGEEWDGSDEGGPGVGVSEPEPPFCPGNPTTDPFRGDENVASAPTGGRRRHVVSDADVALLAESLYVPDTSTNRLTLTEYGAYVAGRVRSIADSPGALAHAWARKPERDHVLEALTGAGIDLDALTPPGAEPVDPFDALVTLAWDQPTRTRAERARGVRERRFAELEVMSAAARGVIEALLDRYEQSGIDDAVSPEALNLPPLSTLGTRREVLNALGDDGWSGTVRRVQEWIYSMDSVS